MSILKINLRDIRPSDIEALSNQFCIEIVKDLTPVQLRRVNRKNRRAEDQSTCATHEEIDSNMTMLRAFEIVFGKRRANSILKHEALIHLWNEAWTNAKDKKFGLD